MKLTATVTALRTNGRMEITVVTSASGLEQCITADNDDYALDQELVLLVLTKEQAASIYEGVDRCIAGSRVAYGADVADFLDSLRPDAPPPWEQSTAEKVYLGRDATPAAETLLNQPDTAETQEFVREEQR